MMKMTLLLYSFFSFDYLLISIIGIGKFSKDTAKKDPGKIFSAFVSSIMFSGLVYVLYKIKSVKVKDSSKEAKRRAMTRKETLHTIS